MANFDLILLALIAVFIFLRLRSVLGSKDGNEDQRNHRDRFDPSSYDQDQEDMAERDNVIHLPTTQNHDQSQMTSEKVNEIEPVGKVQQALAEIMEEDHNFDQHEFVKGARIAFEMILDAFANDERNTLKMLLTDDVYKNFVSALEARKAAGETLETTLVSVKSIEIIDASLENHMANVTLRIISEQINVTQDSDGQIVDGDNNYIDTIIDIWTLARDLTSSNPTWYLKATDSE